MGHVTRSYLINVQDTKMAKFTEVEGVQLYIMKLNLRLKNECLEGKKGLKACLPLFQDTNKIQ